MGFIRNGLDSLRNFLKNDPQAHQKIAAAFTAFVTIYILNTIEIYIVSFFCQIFSAYSSLLFIILGGVICGLVFLFLNELIELVEKAKKLDQNILKALCVSFCFLVSGMIVVHIYGDSQLNQLNDMKNVNMAQFKLDLNEKFYLDNDLVTSDHLAQLRKNFNSHIKLINKKISKQDTSKSSNDEKNSEKQLFIDGDIVALYNYLDKTIPLFIVNEAEEENAQGSNIQYLISLFLIVVSIYMIAKAMFTQILADINSKIHTETRSEPMTKVAELVKVYEPVKVHDQESECRLIEPEPVKQEITKSSVETQVESLFETRVEAIIENKEVIEKKTEEFEKPEPSQIIVEYCLNCENLKNMYENKKEEETEVASPYKSFNPFKKSIQNLNRGEITQMSYPGGSSFDEIQPEYEEMQQYERLADEDAEQSNYADEEAYADEEYKNYAGNYEEQQETYNDETGQEIYDYEEDHYEQNRQEYIDEEEQYQDDQIIADKDAQLTQQAKNESQYNRAMSSLSDRITKKANSTSSLSTSEAVNDLLNWLLFNDLEYNSDLDFAIRYVNLLNLVIQDLQLNDDKDRKPGDIYFKSVETLPPKFTNIQTVVSATDSLTLKACLDFNNIELKAELKKLQRQFDIKVLNASAQVLIVLSQNQNHLFNIECKMDPYSDCIVNIKEDSEIDQVLIEDLKVLFKEAAKQTVLNLELNFLSKRISNSRSASTQLNLNQSLSTEPTQISSVTIMPNHGKNESRIVQNTSIHSSSSPQPIKTSNEKRLLVKLIKATNLANCEEPYCVVELDYPMQKHITDIHEDMSTIDEQFLFDIVENSEELTFSVFDRAKDYGNDLIGEAVLPVTDLCSTVSGKRVIQLHRYGHTKTGSITAEFIFIDPEPQTEELNRDGINSRSSIRNNLLFQEDPMLNTQRLLNPELLSTGSYSSPTQASLQTSTQSAPYTTQNIEPIKDNKVSTGPRINRNYLQVQANSYRANTLNQQNQLRSRIGTSQNDINTFIGTSNNEPKRTRSISRSVRNLFSNKSIKRDKSYDSGGIYNTNNTNYDVTSENSSNGSFTQLKRIRSLSRSVRDIFTKPSQEESNSYQNNSLEMENGGLKKSKSIGRSIKKLFTIGKNNRGTVIESTSKTTRPESVGPGTTVRYQLTPQRQYLYDSSQNVNSDSIQNLHQHQRSSSLAKADYLSP